MIRSYGTRTGFALALTFVAAIAVTTGAAAQQTGADTRPIYDLKQCVEIALAGSPSLAIAGQQTESAAKDKLKAWGNFLPMVSLSRTWSKNERTDFDVDVTATNFVTVPTVDPTGTVQFPFSYATGEKTDSSITTSYKDYSVQSSLVVFDGLGKFGGLKSAKNSLAAAKADEMYSRQLVIQEVATSYFSLLRKHKLLEVSEGSRDLAQRELEKSETYYRLGSVAKSDVLQAKVRLQQTKLDVVRAANAVEQAFAELAHSMNQPLAQRFDVDMSLLETSFDMPALADLYPESQTERLDLLSKHYTFEARNGEVTSAGKGLWPSLQLFANYTRYQNESPYRFGAQDSDNLQYGYRVNWDIFDRFMSYSGRSQAKARARIADYELQQKKLDIQLEVRTLYNSLVEARERILLSRETIEQAREELRLAQERFKVGAGTTLDRINAEVNLASARADEVDGICDFLINSLQLDRAVGAPLDGLFH